ncbi:hypothetical protein TNIN_410571, partial [Trichonephila inaurata madagascariensis]
MTCCGE